ncbi:putative ribonuclease H superfamily [Plasmopara halstedii]
MLPLVEFCINNAVQASTGFTPFYINGLCHPALPLCLTGDTNILVRERIGKRSLLTHYGYQASNSSEY